MSWHTGGVLVAVAIALAGCEVARLAVEAGTPYGPVKLELEGGDVHLKDRWWRSELSDPGLSPPSPVSRPRPSPESENSD